MRIRALWWCWLVCLVGTCMTLRPTVCRAQSWDGRLVQYGKMHEAIGKQQHQGRVQLKDPVKRAHFFGVGALEGLEGEVTILDGRVTVTQVDSMGQLRAGNETALDSNATILAGAYVPSWTEQMVAVKIDSNEYDTFIAEAASVAGIQASTPFVFTVEGVFDGLKLHVINGACPLHAQRNKTEVPMEHRPFEKEFNNVRGTLVGVFAKNAAGDLTHPGTSTHTHVLFKDAVSGKTMTGHVERVTLTAGAVLRLPELLADES